MTASEEISLTESSKVKKLEWLEKLTQCTTAPSNELIISHPHRYVGSQP
jgi:hypothetical protein